MTSASVTITSAECPPTTMSASNSSGFARRRLRYRAGLSPPMTGMGSTLRSHMPRTPLLAMLGRTNFQVTQSTRRNSHLPPSSPM